MKEEANRLLDKQCTEHPLISRGDGIFGVSPHIKGARFTVSDVLGYLYQGRSIKFIAKNWNFTEEQVKEAIAYAQDVIDELVQASMDEAERDDE